MEKGSYTKRRADFARYAASVFNPYLFSGSIRSQLGCGATALALLTGTPPEVIAQKRGSTHYPDEFMIGFLRKLEFRILPLTLCRVSSTDAIIGPENVILVSQLFRENEATWGVIYNRFYYHNFALYAFDELSFLNKPILSAYLVVHPQWRLKFRRAERHIQVRDHRGFPFRKLKIAGS